MSSNTPTPMPSTSTPSSSTPQRPELCLGLHLGAREIGVAVGSRERLLDCHVLNVRKVPSREGKERSFRVLVEQWLARYAPARIAVVAALDTQDDAFIEGCLAWLGHLVEERGLTLRSYTAEEVKGALCHGQGKPTLRLLARELCERYPELWSKSPDARRRARAAPAEGRPLRELYVRSAHERYWSRVFLAAGALVHDLESQLRNKLCA